MSDEDPFRSRPPIDDLEACALLRSGDLDILGRMPYSSNGTFLCDVIVDEDKPLQAIYKPEQGEEPLRDFPPKLYKREVAAYMLSSQLGWGHVPPTIESDGPYGIGSLQLFVPADFEQHYLSLKDRPELNETLKQICAFDFVANNTDRKSGHVLIDDQGELWAIDNGLSFHAEFKLRTVIWDFADDPLPQSVTEGLNDLLEQGLSTELAALLDPFERDAVNARARALLTSGVFPSDPTGRRYPWPIV